MELNPKQKTIITDIARIQVRDLTFILITERKILEIYEHIKEQNYDITIKEVKREILSQLNQWAKVKRTPHLFIDLLDSTEKDILRHHTFQYLMNNGHNEDTAGLWRKLNISEQLDKLNLN